MKPIPVQVLVLLAAQSLGGYCYARQPGGGTYKADIAPVHYQDPGQKPISFDDQIKRLKSQSAEERRDAIERLAELADHRAVDPLIGMLADQTADIRASAIDALGALEDTRAVDPVIGMLKDRTEFVRSAAARVLGQLGDARAVTPLIGLLSDSSSSVRGAAAVGLGMLKDARAVPELIPKLREQSPDVRAAVANGLGGLRDKRAVPALLPLLKDDYGMVKVAAALALADIGDKAAVSPLKEAIASEKDDEVRAQLGEALKRLEAAADRDVGQASSLSWPPNRGGCALAPRVRLASALLSESKEAPEISRKFKGQAGSLSYTPRA